MKMIPPKGLVKVRLNGRKVPDEGIDVDVEQIEVLKLEGWTEASAPAENGAQSATEEAPQ